MMEFISSVVEFIKTVAIIIVIAFFVRFYLVQPFVVDGSSMEPNFHNGEYLLVDKITYRLRQPQRGDVIVFHPPPSPTFNYIKRIIGLPGDKIDIKDGEIFINGVKLQEPYLEDERTIVRVSDFANVDKKLGSEEYFVLGDNRDHSSDSREWGTLPKANIIGRAWLVIFPQKYFGFVFHPRYAGIPGLAQAATQ